jgi:cytochrome c oxidase assembly protein subunit 15
MRGFRGLAVMAAMAVYGQIVLGGVVRITGSGLGCPDWPACQGQVVPDFTNSHVVIEYAHRLVGTAAGILMIAVAICAALMYWRRHSEATPMPKGLMLAALAGVGLIVLQGVLGGITVLMGNSPFTVAIHLGNALLVLAAALLVAIWAGRVAAPAAPLAVSRHGGLLPRLLTASVAATFVIVLSGAYVVGAGASASCTSWPLCGAPSGTAGADIHFLHRVIVLLAAIVILGTVRYAQRRWRGSPIVVAAYLAGFAFIAEAAVGAAQVLVHLPQALRAIHLALATAVWAGVVLMAAAYWLETRTQPAPGSIPASKLREMAAQ